MGAGERFNLHFVTHCVTIEMVKIDKIIWDEWNVKHVARHGVVSSEVEEALHEDFLARETYRERLLITGITKSCRIISVVVHEDKKNVFYVVTARGATGEETQLYNKKKRGELE